MTDPRFEEIQTIQQFARILLGEDTVWLLILGDGGWRDTVLSRAKEQITDQPQFMALWLKDVGILSVEQQKHFIAGKAGVVACGIANNGGVVEERLDESAAKKGARLGRLLHQAEAYSGRGYCLIHGDFDGKKCARCISNA